MGLAVYGKHPAKGDFVEHGLPANLKPQLEAWLDQVLAEAKHGLGENWESVWRGARPLRFWLGEAIWGERICGVLMASVDRVGRRFPLAILAFGNDATRVPAPVVAADQDWYAGLEAHLLRVQRAESLAAPVDLLIGAPGVPGEAGDPAPDDFWAVRASQDVTGLWADVGLTDHSRASLGRSYWWVAGDAPLAEAAKPVEEAEETQAPADDVQTPEEPQDDKADAALPEEELPDAALSPEDAEPVSAWELPDDDDSPFASDTARPALFAAPQAAEPAKAGVAPELAVAAPAKPAVKQLWSQVWAGNGLPSGHVIAWFLRGYDGKG